MLIHQSLQRLDATQLRAIQAGGDPSPHPDIRLQLWLGNSLVISALNGTGWISTLPVGFTR